jgi:hypothetical protein
MVGVLEMKVCKLCNCREENQFDLAEKREKNFLTHPWFIYPKSDKASVKKRAFDRYDNWSDIQSDVEIFKWFRFSDPYDGQEILARVNIEQRVWIRGPKWIHWLTKFIPGAKLVKRTLDIEFNKEVGSRKGSWKGGTTGCSYEMKPNESIDDAWKRCLKDKEWWKWVVR